MPLTEHVDWSRMVAASCRRVHWLFLDQGVAGRERLRRVQCVSVYVCDCVFKKYCSLKGSSLFTQMLFCSSAPLKPGWWWCLFHALNPLSSPLSCGLSISLLSPSLSPFPSWLSVQMSGLSLYLLEPKATSCTLCLPLSLQCHPIHDVLSLFSVFINSKYPTFFSSSSFHHNPTLPPFLHHPVLSPLFYFMDHFIQAKWWHF